MKIASIVLMIVGFGLAVWGYQLSGSFGSQLSQGLTGSYSEKEMALFIGGAASFAVGVFIFFKK